MTQTAHDVASALGLSPHPEGGWYRETYRHASVDGQRGDMTAIYFLLDDGPGSAWHRVTDADEVWCFHGGAPLELTIETETGSEEVIRLGPALHRLRTQAVVPRGLWQKSPQLRQLESRELRCWTRVRIRLIRDERPK